MKIIIARHGESINVGDQGCNRDIDRTLTPLGKKEISYVGNGLKSLNLIPELIISSPFKRTLETSKVIIESIGQKIELNSYEDLQSGARFENYQIAFEELNLFQYSTIMFVGHAPDVCRVSDILAGMKGLYFGTGYTSMIDVEHLGIPGKLQGFWSPEMLKRVSINLQNS